MDDDRGVKRNSTRFEERFRAVNQFIDRLNNSKVGRQAGRQRPENQRSLRMEMPPLKEAGRRSITAFERVRQARARRPSRETARAVGLVSAMPWGRRTIPAGSTGKSVLPSCGSKPGCRHLDCIYKCVIIGAAGRLRTGRCKSGAHRAPRRHAGRGGAGIRE